MGECRTGRYGKETVKDVMPGVVERHFGQYLPSDPLERLMDNASAYRTHKTWVITRMRGSAPRVTVVRTTMV